MNLQESGAKAKPYQVRQVRAVIIKYGLEVEVEVVNKYELIIYWSDEDDAFVVDVPELPGCMAHGETREAAMQAATEAIELWVETAQEEGRPVPEPKGRRLMYA